MLVLLVMLLAAGAAAAWQQVRAMLYEKPAVMTSDMVVVPVLEGDSVTRVLGRLAQAGVEVPIWQAKLLTRLEPTLVRKIHVGRFRFTRGMTPYNVLETLSGPALVDKQLRIPEGAALWTVEDILASAEDLSPESAKLTDDALLERLGVKSMEGASDTATLEGFLAPDTYRYGSGTSDLIVLEQAAARQRRLVDEAWATRSYGENAILYRMNAQSNALERVLIRKDIPYRIYGGTRFYDRKEIRDMIAYMSIVENPSDIVRFGRIVNEPKRGIGDATVALIENITSDLHVSPLEVMQNVDDYPVLSKKAQALKKFAQMWTDLQNASLEMTLEEFLDYLLDKTGYRTAMQALGEEGELRLENIEELKSSMHTYEESAEEATLSGFLEEISLYTDVDKYEPDQDVVMLMTVHSAKGLEFSNVYLVGMEQGVFPGMRSMDSKDDVEEERRLAYVALTRAKKHLTISTTSSRMLFGMTMRNLPSQFLKEIDSSLIAVEKKQRSFGQKAVSRAPEPVQSMFLQRQMTAQKSAKPSPSGTIDLRVGDRIRHKTFGEGTILSMEKMGNDTMLEIGFDLVGTKKIMANFARSKFQKLS